MAESNAYQSSKVNVLKRIKTTKYVMVSYDLRFETVAIKLLEETLLFNCFNLRIVFYTFLTL